MGMYATSVIEGVTHSFPVRHELNKCPECFTKNKDGKLWRESSPVVRQCRKCGAVIDIEINKVIVKRD